jgi:tetratricopeptide (TPR) repeat protein
VSVQPPEPAGSSTPPAPAHPLRQTRLWILLTLFLATACVVGWVVLRNTSADAPRDAAVKAANQGRFTEAEPALKAAYAKHPDDVEVVEALARGYSETENAAEAEIYLTRWVELKPLDPNVLRLRYQFYRKIKAAEKAYADGKRLLEIEHTDSPVRRQAIAQVRRSLVGQAFSLGHFEDAENLCQACLRETPADADLRATLAEIRRVRGDAAGAAAILDQLLKENPANPRAMFARGNLYLDTGEPEKAVPLLREVLKSDRSRQRTAGAQLVVALERTGQTEEAKRVAADVHKLQDVEVYGEAMKSQPENLEIRVRLAERLLADGHTDEGLANLKAVLAIDPRCRSAHLALAAHYDKQGQPEKAAEHRRLAGPTP